MAEDKKWYYAKDGKPYGPMTEYELCKAFEAGSFTGNDYVFCKGETDGWVKASSISGLCDSLALDAEPEPQKHEVPLYERASYELSKGDQAKKQKPK